MSTVSDTHDTGRTSRPLPGAPSDGGLRGLLHAVRRRWSNAEIFTAPPRSEWPAALRRARTIGFVLLGIQLVGLLVWSSVVVHRFSLTVDFSAYEQAAWLIGHGHLNPFSSVLARPFWHNDSELIMWPIGVIVRLSPSLVTLPWLQDLAIVAGEGVALAWMCDVIAARHQKGRQSTSISVALVLLGVVLLIGNPWSIWAASFDFHLEALITLCSLGAARDLHRGRRSAWIWVAVGLLCGAVGASYIGAVGASAALSGRIRLRRGLIILLLGFGLLVLLEVIHGANTSGLIAYSEIVTGKSNFVPGHITSGQIVKAGIEHPGRVVHALWGNRANIWGNMSPGGVIGLIWLPLIAPILLVTAESGLGAGGMNFSLPGFQNIAIPLFVTVGTVVILATLASLPSWRTGRRKWIVPSLIGLMMVNSVVWAVVWLPQIGNNWLTVTPGAAKVIAKLRKEIRPGDEVAPSQGFAGAFADRQWLFQLMGSQATIPVRARRIWIILGPTQGVENPNVAGGYADVAQLAANPHMRLMVDADGIWAFEWTPPKGTQRLTLKGPWQATMPAWTIPGTAGSAIHQGPRSQWYTASDGQPGYVVDEGYWREPRGTYRAEVTLSSSRLANVELWDATTSTLLARTVLHNSHGKRTVALTGTMRTTPRQATISGSALWRMSPTVPAGNSLEVRVWTPGGKDHVNVYQVAVTKPSATSS